jgi:hypothetical protein
MIKGDNITNHVAKVENIARVLKDIGQPITNEMIITKIICNLPPNYNNIVVAWDNLPTIIQTIRSLTTQLFNQDHFTKIQQGDESGEN